MTEKTLIKREPRVALVHDWLTGMRGGEKVLEVLCELYPDATLFTLLHIKGAMSPVIENMEIKTSFIQRLPMLKKRYRNYLPLFPTAIEQFDLREFDLIISTSHCVAKGAIAPPGAVHISYVFSPMRYVWDLYWDYFGKGKAGLLTRIVMGLVAPYLRNWDVSSSDRVDCFAADSAHIAKKIKKFYNRDAEAILAPVDCSRFSVSDKVEDYYLVLSAFAPYKRIDIAVEAFNRLGLKLKIIGTGQDEKKLKAMAEDNIEFLGWQSDENVSKHYSRCRALIFPGVEDYGIVPLEAMASGRPVIAYGEGGALETVVPINGPQNKPPTGMFFHTQTTEALVDAVKKFEEVEKDFDPADLRAHALGFDRERFKERLSEFITNSSKSIKKPTQVA